MHKQHEETQMPNQKDDRQQWDDLLDSQEGMDAFAELMKEAQKEVEEGKVEAD